MGTCVTLHMGLGMNRMHWHVAVYGFKVGTGHGAGMGHRSGLRIWAKAEHLGPGVKMGLGMCWGYFGHRLGDDCLFSSII